jgi:Rod binding domain-containing protein
MSLPASAVSSAGLPVVNQATEPEWVRKGSAATQRAYASALSFEQTLVEQLARSMTAGTGLEGEGSEGEGSGDPQSGEISTMLPQALASGVVNGGGLGLAAELTRSLEGVQGASATASTGETGAAPAGTATGGTGAATDVGSTETTGGTGSRS